MYQRKQVKKHISPQKLPSPPKSCLKYKQVSAVVDAGPNMRKRREALEMIRQYYHVRPDELFRRIKPSTLVGLLVEVARLRLESAASKPACEPGPEPASGDAKPASDLQSLVEGCGELSLSSGDFTPAAPVSVEEQPYLLLDVRDSDVFRQEHIVTARHYPAARLSRTINYETTEMWRYRTHPHAVVVVYDENETIAQRCATTLVQRGYENVFILSGGLKMARRRFPYGLLTSGDKEMFTAADVEALNGALEDYCSANADGGAGPASARSPRSICSTAARTSASKPGRTATATATPHPNWKI